MLTPKNSHSTSSSIGAPESLDTNQDLKKVIFQKAFSLHNAQLGQNAILWAPHTKMLLALPHSTSHKQNQWTQLKTSPFKYGLKHTKFKITEYWKTKAWVTKFIKRYVNLRTLCIFSSHVTFWTASINIDVYMWKMEILLVWHVLLQKLISGRER